MKNRYSNMSEEKKQRLKEYQKNYRKAKSLNIIVNKIVLKLWSNSECSDFLVMHIVINKIIMV